MNTNNKSTYCRIVNVTVYLFSCKISDILTENYIIVTFVSSAVLHFIHFPIELNYKSKYLLKKIGIKSHILKKNNNKKRYVNKST